ADLRDLGERREALALFERALAAWERLYPSAEFPRGHPELASALANLAAVLLEAGEPGRALTHYGRALAIYREQAEVLAASAPEAEALAFLASLPAAADGYLAASARVEGSAAAAYGQVWRSKALLTRVLER